MPFSPDKFTELSYDVVLPSHLLVSNEVEASAKLLYGLIRNLTKRDGYCFASNKYLAELMDVDIRTIQRWLQSLQQNGYVEVDVESEATFNPQRRITIVDNFKKSLQHDKNVTPPRQKCHPPMTNLSSPLYKDERRKVKEDSVKEPPAPNASAEASALAQEFLTKIKEKKPDFKPKAFDKWAIEFDKMMRIDRREVDRIKRVISHLTGDIANLVYVQSAKKLREEFDRLEMKLEVSAKKDQANKNREYARTLKNQYPKQMAQMSFDKDYVRNLETAKEVPFNLPTTTFKESLVSMFGGHYERRD